MIRVAGAIAAVWPILWSSAADAETFRVGPSGSYRQLQELPALSPGDVVELEGGAVYTGGVLFGDHGTESNPIVIRGVVSAGARPIISGGVNSVEFAGNHYRFENIEVTAGSSRCVFHRAHDITIESAVIRDCPAQGLLGADDGSGSLTLRFSEIYGNGDGLYRHQIYMATDEDAYPGAVFRMEYNYVHDGAGGHNVKSRAERNEIYYNWIEGALYHELELIGPDGQAEHTAREDSDVVGNVLRKAGANRDFFVVRVGGDGTGQTWGRYRFAHNTILISEGSAPSAVFRIFHGVDSVEMHNNVIAQQGSASGTIRIYRTVEAQWASGSELVIGTNNWIPQSAIDVPTGWTGTLRGADPLFVAAVSFDVSPRSESPLVDSGAASPVSPSGHTFPAPLARPQWLPPMRRLMSPGQESARSDDGAIDIGAIEYGTAPPGEPEPPAEPVDPMDGTDQDDPADSTAGCGVAADRRAGGWSAVGALAAFAWLWPRWRRRKRR